MLISELSFRILLNTSITFGHNTEKAEGAPDRFAQQIYYKELPKVREIVAPMLNSEPDNLAL